jgi:hypothetical protein
LNSEWKCHWCGGSGDLLMMENRGPACLGCVGFDGLEFLPAGDALLSRRVKGKSTTCAVVVSVSRTGRRYERQGLLVEPLALADLQRDLEAQRREYSSLDRMECTTLRLTPRPSQKVKSRS